MGQDREGEICLIKNNMSEDDDVVGGEIKTPAAFVIGGVSKEKTYDGLGCQFVSGFGEDIGIAGTTEHAQLLIGGGDSLERDVWTSCTDHLDGGDSVDMWRCGALLPSTEPKRAGSVSYY
jgi:hypothetical protein